MNAADHDKRVVLPRWLPFRQAAGQREATVFGTTPVVVDFGPTEQALLESVEAHRAVPSPYLAVELMGSAQVLGHTAIAREMAEQVLAQSFLGPVAQEQARAILGQSVSLVVGDEREQIKQTKSRVRAFPQDALAWMDQARLYTVLGNYEKARASVLAALHLAPGNRFVVRAAVRFFVHFGQWDEALRHAQRGYALTADPLIFGPLLSVSSRLGKLPPRLKPLVQAAVNAPEPFLYSETLEAFGTMELMSGADQRAKPFFRRAWQDPTQSVVGHSQWILREHLPALAHEQKINFWSSKEAVSWLRYSMLDFSRTVIDANAWALEEPYSRAPHILGSMAACMEGNFDEAVATAKRGLLANPRDEILQNNLAFTYLRDGKVAEGAEAFVPLKAKLDDKSQVATVATYGLLLMCQGDQEGGARYYGEAISRALAQNNRRLAVRATLNYLISTLDTAKTLDPSLLKSAQIAMGELQDPGCFGAASVIVRKLTKSDMRGSDALSAAAREFCTAVEREREKFEGSVMANLLAAAPKPAEPAPK